MLSGAIVKAQPTCLNLMRPKNKRSSTKSFSDLVLVFEAATSVEVLAVWALPLSL